MTRRQLFLASPFMTSPFVSDVKLYGTALLTCITLSLDYTPGGIQ